jgi:hypothetical protein
MGLKRKIQKFDMRSSQSNECSWRISSSLASTKALLPFRYYGHCAKLLPIDISTSRSFELVERAFPME